MIQDTLQYQASIQHYEAVYVQFKYMYQLIVVKENPAPR